MRRSPRRPWWFSVLACTALMLAVPQYGDTAMLLDLSLVMILSLLALSMGFLWGYVGILSFGQTIFFGLGGYAYALCSLNTDLPLAAFALAAVVPMLFALLLGCFMMYGRISDIYLSVITLVVTLIFEKGVRATSGPEYVIGSVRLNGQNGIPGLPGLPLRIGPLDLQSIEGIFYLALGLLALAYIGIRLFLASAPGRVMVGLRENERRMELLGYDSRRYKLMAFVIAGGLAAVRRPVRAVGKLRRPGNVQPESGRDGGHLVIVGGRSLLLGAIIGTLLIQYLTTWLGTVGVGQVTLTLGFILILCVLLFQGWCRHAGACWAGCSRGGAKGATDDAARHHSRSAWRGQALRRRPGAGQYRLHPAARRTALPDRAERRGQEHLLQAAQRSDGAVGR